MRTMQTAMLGLATALLISPNVLAIEAHHEYQKRIEGAQRLTALGDDLMGESVSLYNGATEFSMVDIDLPGNNGLPVHMGRRLAIEARPVGPGVAAGRPELGGIGNWSIDVPYLSGTFESQYGWHSMVPPGTLSDQRCSVGIGPYTDPIYPQADIYQGVVVHVPGQGDRAMLRIDSTSTPVPASGLLWTTRERDMFRCIAMRSGMSGGGFSMASTDGTRYDFDVAVTRDAGALKYRATAWGSPRPARGRTRIYLLASKVTDRFGNTVEFQYRADGYPSKITSSDGREIQLGYVNGRLETATGNDRTWSYHYAGTGNDSLLTSVSQPDTSQWQYAYTGNLSAMFEPWDGESSANCAPTVDQLAVQYDIAITHPSGAIGKFQLANRRHFRSGVRLSNCVEHRPLDQDPYYELIVPHYFDVMTLQKKTISGPGLTQPMTWTYRYNLDFQDLFGTRVPLSTPCATCPVSKDVVVTRQDGTQQIYRYGFLHRVNEGQLLETILKATDGSVERMEKTTYMSMDSNASQVFTRTYGLPMSDSPTTSYYILPEILKQVQQDGRTFNRKVESGCSGTAYCFDIFARPTKVSKYSTPMP